MDLPYPSQKDDQLAAHLSPYDRRRSLVLKDSLKLIPTMPPLPRTLRDTLTALLAEDLPYELRQQIEKEVVSFRAEVGRQNSCETILHVACRQNAPQCLEYLLRTYYQHFPQDYQPWVNAGTRQGMTAAMICVLSQANESLALLLRFGGVDIHLIDSNKSSAYQIALNCKNQVAVKMLMQYQNGSKRGKLINHQLLAMPVQLEPGRVGWCQQIYKCFIDCLTCATNEEENQKNKKNRKRGPSVIGAGIQGFFMDQVELGFSYDELNGNQIEWKLMGEYQDRGKLGILFDTFSPFDMEDITHPISHFLIILQSLSQHPWLVRRAIQLDKSKAGSYCVSIFQKQSQKNIIIDSHIPFIRGANQPLFIADKKQGWPMLLQKGMAKLAGSYKKIQNYTPSELIQSLTGWPVVRKQIQSGRDSIQLMQKINSLGYMYVLEGKINSLLASPHNSIACFTVLTFFSRGDKRLVLINCPFVDPAWVQKQRHEMLALKILRGHYNCRDQMTIWIEEERLKEYFSAILVAPVKSGFQRQSIHLSAGQSQNLYFRIVITAAQEQSLIMQLLELDTGKMIPLSQVQGWRGEREKVKFMNPQICREDMLEFEGKEGEYLFKAVVSKGRYQLVIWVEREVKLQPIQESFAGLEWVSCLRQGLSKNWKDNDKYIMEYTGEFTLLMLRAEANIAAQIQCKGEVLQGKRGQGNRVHLANEKGFAYCVVRGKIQGIPSFSF